MPGMQHDNNNIDGYRDQESKNEEETCGRGFRRGQETRAECRDPRRTRDRIARPAHTEEQTSGRAGGRVS